MVQFLVMISKVKTNGLKVIGRKLIQNLMLLTNKFLDPFFNVEGKALLVKGQVKLIPWFL